SEIDRGAFSGLRRLTLLNLQNNQLRTVPPEALQNLENLRSLHLDANLIRRPSSSSFKGLGSLHHLRLDDNRLTEVPVLALRPLIRLRALTLALNGISSVPDRAFATLRCLLVLHLHDNQIQSLGPRSFRGLEDLETLDLSSNWIKTFPEAIRDLISLRVLNLQKNFISVIPENIFTENLSIQIINLQDNRLLTVGHLSLQLLPELRTQSVWTSDRTDHVLRDLDLQQVSQGQDTSRVMELKVFVESRSLKDPLDRHSLARCLDSLHFIFIVSIVLNLLVLVSILLPPKPVPSPCLPLSVFWFRLLAGLSGSRIISTDWFFGSVSRAEPGSGSVLCSVCSEVCVFILMGSMVSGRTRSCCVVVCSLALILVWTQSSALVLFNIFCFLFTILTHIPRLPHLDLVPLSILTHTLLLLSSPLSPDDSTCAALSCCMDPLIHMVLSPGIRWLQEPEGRV
ncbi:leucine-rich repeat-containing G-protein coupled receptor 4-like, partial [Echeneis naucrates]|uniref:leucine-rich repeat-containing G-protein coupled receptor 4-like n=1 Tax=Echeneis naucrates TaxID=173247 RepID=UPI001113D5EC